MESEKFFSIIQNANDQIKESWENIYEISKLFEDKECADIAFRRTIPYDPGNSKIISAHASSDDSNIQEVLNELTKILQEFANGLPKQPNSISSWIKAAHCYILLRDFTNAYSAYSNVLRLTASSTNEDPYFWYGIGCVYQHFNYHKAALQYFLNVLEISPQFPQIADIHFRLALSHRSLQNFNDALQIFDSIIATQAYPSNLTQDDILFQIGYTNQLMGKTEAAARIYNDLYKKHPNNSDLIQQYCWFLSLQNDDSSLDKAESIIDAFNQNDPTLKFILARIAMKKREMPLAYDRYRVCISYWNNSPLFWCGLGVLYFLNNQDQDAIVAFQRALYLDYELPEAWSNLGLIFELQDDGLKNALKIYESAIAQCSNNEKLRERYAAIQSKRAKPADRSMILEINDSKIFVQIADRISTEFIETPPVIPPNQIGLDFDQDTLIKSLKLSYNSMFYR